jgi:energy-coupling factor transport system permease protein
VSDRAPARLDPRAWLVWGVAASAPALLGRNPFVLTATLLAVLGARGAWHAAGPGTAGWRSLLRLTLVFAAISILFNVLTAHVGNQVILHLPSAAPIVGGPLTLNALVYGVLSAIAVLTLVLVGTTLGVVLDWTALLRLLPPRLSTVAVAGSVAWAFIPQTATALTEIREAQMARGHRPRGVRDLVPLVAPLLAGGLERALTLAEALESRAFGAPLGATIETEPHPWRSIVTVAGLTTGIAGAYVLATGQTAIAVVLLAVTAVALFVVGRDPAGGERPRRTRYREPDWGRSETAIAGTAGVVLLVEMVTLALDPAALAYDPYPDLVAPRVALPLLAALALLLAPAAVAP